MVESWMAGQHTAGAGDDLVVWDEGRMDENTISFDGGGSSRASWWGMAEI